MFKTVGKCLPEGKSARKLRHQAVPLSMEDAYPANAG